MKTEFWLEGRVVPKARPRFNGTRAYTKGNYAAWKNDAIKNLLSLNLDSIEVPVSLSVIAVGFLRGDADNIVGSVMDALVQSGVLPNDTLSWVPKISLEYRKGQKGVVGVWVEIVPHQVENFSLFAHVAKAKTQKGRYFAAG